MSPTVSYRLFNSYDKSSILNLMKFIYPDYPYDEAYYTWQYLRNPAGESRIFLAECEGEIVGMYCLIPNTIELGARHCKIWRVQNVMMRPDFRMKGTFFELMMAAQQHQSWLDTDFFFAFPNENSFRSFEKFGYVVQNDVIFFEMNRHPKHEILQQYQITIANNFSFPYLLNSTLPQLTEGAKVGHISLLIRLNSAEMLVQSSVFRASSFERVLTFFLRQHSD